MQPPQPGFDPATCGAKYYVNGRQVCGYDLVNATLHCACSVLVAVVARRVMRIAALHACLATMLFAAHPVHAEAALHYILKNLEQCDVDDLHCANIHSIHSGMLKDLGDLTSSAQSYEAAIRLDPYLAHAHLDLAVIRHLKSVYPGAFRHYRVAMSLDPKNQLIIDNMANLRRRITWSLTSFHDCDYG
ncbi:hypothetical protein HPB51_028790 [Rhipicephalus microplus]|uniref:Uncharacterized protein n=1 Tax=Rhipicephalus microplus TaxID=6941 RepID=A0A9J6CWC3_RHIMP|nr:hypothetical protein HPB51_028790 [Rhipicephalus microplus]